LDSIDHPLRHDEKAVDLTAMLLGFAYPYRTGAHTVTVEQIQSQPSPRRRRKTIIKRLERRLTSLFERSNKYKFLRKKSLGYLSEPEIDAACKILMRRGVSPSGLNA
jgi:hypothetical protein